MSASIEKMLFLTLNFLQTGWFPKSYVKETTSTTPIGSQRPSSPKTSPNLKRKAPEPPGGKSAAGEVLILVSLKKYESSF